MALNITASGAVQVAGSTDGIQIQVNKTLSGTITVTTAGSTQTGTSSSTVATITNPTVGDSYRYSGLRNQGIVSVNPSGTTDITVSQLAPGPRLT